MRILLVNKFHYLRGGSEKYYFELAGQVITGQFQGMAMLVSIVFSAASILVAAELSLHRRDV